MVPIRSSVAVTERGQSCPQQRGILPAMRMKEGLRNPNRQPFGYCCGQDCPRSVLQFCAQATILFACFFVILCPLNSRAAETDPRFERWFAAQTNMQSWTADLVQTRTLKVLAQPLKSNEKVWVAQEQFRWELGQPAQTIAV